MDFWYEQIREAQQKVTKLELDLAEARLELQRLELRQQREELDL